MLSNKSATIDYKELELKNKLGEGGYGVVYKGTWRYNDVAVKQLLMDKISSEAAQEFERESQMMKELRSPNIVQFYGYCISPKYSIVMEYMPMGSLFNILHSDKPLDWSIRTRIAVDISKGVAFLHAENILHRDIKSLNVLLDETYKAKLTDFGLSKVKTETRSYNMTTKKNTDSVGTVQWMAPELFARKAVYTSKSDMYSLGMTFWELAARKIPFADASSRDLIPGWVQQGEREDIPFDCSAKLASLIKACWEGAPEKRPDANTVVTLLLKDTIENKVNDNSVNSGPTYLNNLNSEIIFNNNSLTLEPLNKLRTEKSSVKLLLLSGKLEKLNLAPQSPSFTPKVLLKQPPKVNAQELSKFLKLVAEGEQDQAETMLKVNKDLALVPGKVTDLSHRTFKDITAFQYALWALDWHMWTMLLKYIPIEHAREQAKQSESGSWVGEHDIHANWNKLMLSLSTCIQLWNQSKWLEGKQHWVQQVGRAQLLLPAHVINEYCHPIRSMSPCPDFTKREPNGDWRTRVTCEGEWFTCQYQEGSLGEKFAVVRGPNSKAICCEGRRSKVLKHLDYEIDGSVLDHAGIWTLYDTRASQRKNFIIELTKGVRLKIDS